VHRIRSEELTSVVPVWLPADKDGNELDQWIAGHSADEWLAQEAAGALRHDPLVRGTYLEIIVQNRVVVLRGDMDSPEAREAAGRRIWTLPGVADVSNQLSVAGDLG
jgi:osmotically-inducible protein OsmY